MPRLTNHHVRRGAIAIVATAGFGMAALAGITVAMTFTLHVAKHAPVTNQSAMTTHENIVVNSKSHAVYTLTGDSKTHPECTKANSCFMFWPPVTVASRKSLSKAPGVRGRLGVWRRHGILQVTLNGHPLYTYSGDASPRSASGEGVIAFGGTWHVKTASKKTSGGW
jgi:predicted lipoprotein with Yx(FWY)xxD motif